MKLSEEGKKGLLIFGIAVSFRVVMYLLSAVILAFQIGDGMTFGLEEFLSAWCKWDAHHYVNIATNGYQGAVEVCETCRAALLEAGGSEEAMQNGQHLFLVFFPLYPYILRFLRFLFSDLRVAGMVVSTLAYAGGCVYTYKFIKLDYSETVARNSVILLSLFPFSFFFGGIMTEGLFLLISAGMLYYIRKHKWWIAIVFGVFATMTRMQGMLLIVPAGLELLVVYRPIQKLREKDFKAVGAFLGRCCSFLIMFLGTAVYLFANWKVDGYAFAFQVYQKSHWGQGACLPTKTIQYVFSNAFTDTYNLQYRISLWIPEAILFIVVLAALIYGIKKLHAMHMGYGIAYFLLTYSATWLLSAGRYLSCGIPLFLVFGIMTEKRKWLMPVLTVVFSMLQIIYLMEFFNNMQIM